MELTPQQLHNLAMNIAGKALQKKGFEFLAINSSLQTSPQFVAVDSHNTLYFVIVKAILYPNNPANYDVLSLETFKHHATQKKAQVLYAGVGLANASNYEKPLTTTQDYVVNFSDFITI